MGWVELRLKRNGNGNFYFLFQSPEKGSNKARLLARMSKMGKNVLTIPGAVAADPDHDLDDSGLV